MNTSIILAAIRLAAPAAALLWSAGAWSTARGFTPEDRARLVKVSAACEKIAMRAVHEAWLGRDVQWCLVALMAVADTDSVGGLSEDTRREALKLAAVAQRAVRGGAPLEPQRDGQPALGEPEGVSWNETELVRVALKMALGTATDRDARLFEDLEVDGAPLVAGARDALAYAARVAA
jgi:hypothetical protein